MNMKWISIKDEVPGYEVLATNKGKDYLVGYITKTAYGALRVEDEHQVLEPVTHWAKLEPPNLGDETVSS